MVNGVRVSGVCWACSGMYVCDRVCSDVYALVVYGGY